MKHSYRNKDGSLTKWAMILGDIYLYYHPDGSQIRFFKEGCYQVRNINTSNPSKSFWKSFDTMTEGKKYFFSVLRKDYAIKGKNLIKTSFKSEINKIK